MVSPCLALKGGCVLHTQNQRWDLKFPMKPSPWPQPKCQKYILLLVVIIITMMMPKVIKGEEVIVSF